ncbi:MAG TPA: hypothetical protein VFS12_08470 [Terriglobia bacterium]|nr:hypothetical protein [Terriglobia bacterium]
MKRNPLKSICALALAVSVLVMNAAVVVSGQDGGGRLEGTWNVQVTLRNCQTGAQIRTFPSLTTFVAGGTTFDSTSGIPQAQKTPGHGVWSHVSGNIYRFSFKSFSFDTSGTFTGWTKIAHEATLGSNAAEYTSTGTAEFYNASGTLLLTGCSTTTATRFE